MDVVCSSRWLTSSRSSFTAPTKSLPLSLIISFGTLPLLLKRAIALRKLSVSTAQAVSRWMALVWRQVKRHKFLFCRLIPLPGMVSTGSAKSTAHWSNGRKVNPSLIAGSGAVTWDACKLRFHFPAFAALILPASDFFAGSRTFEKVSCCIIGHLMIVLHDQLCHRMTPWINNWELHVIYGTYSANVRRSSRRINPFSSSWHESSVSWLGWMCFLFRHCYVLFCVGYIMCLAYYIFCVEYLFWK